MCLTVGCRATRRRGEERLLSIFGAEVIGTALLILLGNGVVACVLLNLSKGQNSGWIVITFGWGMAVMVGAFAVGQFSGAHLNPAVTLGFAIAGDTEWSDVPEYFAGEFVGRVHRRDARVARVSRSLEGDRGPRPEARLLQHRAGDPQPGEQHHHRDHRHVRARVRHPRVLRQRGDGGDRPGRAHRRSAGARHRALARWPDGLRDQPGPRPRAADHARDPADRGQGRLRLGLRVDPGRRPADRRRARRARVRAFFPDNGLLDRTRRAAPPGAARHRFEHEESLDGEVRGSDRSGHHQHAVHGLRPRRQRRERRPEGARADLSQAGLGRARRDGDLGAHPGGRRRGDGLGRRERGRRRRRRHHQPARDDGGVGQDHGQADPQRARLAGHAHGQAGRRVLEGRRPGPLPGEGRPAAGDLLLRARRSAGSSTTSTARPTAPSRATCCSATWTPGSCGT